MQVCITWVIIVHLVSATLVPAGFRLAMSLLQVGVPNTGLYGSAAVKATSTCHVEA